MRKEGRLIQDMLMYLCQRQMQIFVRNGPGQPIEQFIGKILPAR